MANRYGYDNGWQNDPAYRQAMGQQVGWQQVPRQMETAKEKSNPLIVVAVLAAMLAIALIGQVFFPYLEQLPKDKDRTAQAEATVVDFRHNWRVNMKSDERHDYPVVTFTDSDGVEHREVCTSDPVDPLLARKYEEGEKVTVRYDPMKSYNIKIV